MVWDGRVFLHRSEFIHNIALKRQPPCANAVQKLKQDPQRKYYGTIVMPIDCACPMTLLHNPCRLNPDSLSSDCLIFAIS